MNARLWVASHPHVDSVLLFSSKENAIGFVKFNTKVWAEKNIDEDLFTFQKAVVRDNQLNEIIREGMPELLL